MAYDNSAENTSFNSKSPRMKVVVLGGAGDMGAVAVRDLAQNPKVTSLVIADYNYDKARMLAASLNSPKVSAVRVNAHDRDALVRVLTGCDVAVGAIGPFYEFERICAQAAITAGCNYISLCDDFDAALEVLELDRAARDRGVTVLTGLGWTPGISNVLASLAAWELDSVQDIRVAWGGSASDSDGFAVVLHTLHIFSGNVLSFQNGKELYVPAGSGRKQLLFPPPVGLVNVFHLGHPEPVTLPRNIAGVQTVTLHGGLSENFLNALAIALARIGLTNTAQKRKIVGNIIKPILPMLGKIGKPENPCSAIRVDVGGTKNGRPASITYGAADHMGRLTGIPLAIGTVMLGAGEITHKGVIAPESCITPGPFLHELSKRGIAIYRGDKFTERIN